MIASRRNRFAFLCLACIVWIGPVNGAEPISSMRKEIFNNPFVVIGFNRKTNEISGYISALRTAPGRTDECKFVFAAKKGKGSASTILIKDAGKANNVIEPSTATKGIITLDSTPKKIVIDENSLPGDCGWILPFVGEPHVIENNNAFSINVDGDEIGDWQAIQVISNRRAYFHSEPSDSTAGKAFLVAGDLIYVYEENPGWYYVKYQGRKKETVGWIKKSNTIQFP